MIHLPIMGPSQEAAWSSLLDIAQHISTGWCIVGGQMVHLHCWERNVTSARPTDDIDAVLDIRLHPRILHRFTSVLFDLGFRSAGETLHGHQHRWVRGEAVVDVLLPRHVGPRAAARRGATGGTTLESPGGQGALDRCESVEVLLGNRAGLVLRPTLQGAITSKTAAFTITHDRHRDRHLIDLVVLSTLIRPSDNIGIGLSARERKRIVSALGAIKGRNHLVSTVEGGFEGVARLKLAVASE